MTYAELIATPHIEQDEVQKLVGANYAVPDLEPLRMSPRLEEWVAERRNYEGELNIAKEVIPGSECVVWIRRVGYDDSTGEEYDCYQIGCEHLPAAEAVGDDTAMFTCGALHKALNERAQLVNAAFRHSETLVHFVDYNPRNHQLRLDAAGNSLAEGYVASLLDHTAQHPEVWIGNHMGGSHNTLLLSMTMGIEPSEVNKVAKNLENRGMLEFTSETGIKLSESYRQFLEQFVDTSQAID